jgi:hypothetical protein
VKLNKYAKILGTPIIKQINGRFIILHPLSLVELAFLEFNFKGSAPAIRIEAALYCIWLSARKEDPKIKRKVLNKLLSKKPDLICETLDDILDISVDDSGTKRSSQEPTDVDIRRILSNLADGKGWTVNQVASMSPIQLSAYCGKSQGVSVGSLREVRRVLKEMGVNNGL